MRKSISVFKLNKTDKEILQILRKIFLTKKVRPLASDDHLRIWMIRVFFYMSFAFIILKILIVFLGQELPSEYSAMAATPIAFFFGTLFLYINSESENTSILVFGLTWVSIVVALFMA